MNLVVDPQRIHLLAGTILMRTSSGSLWPGYLPHAPAVPDRRGDDAAAARRADPLRRHHHSKPGTASCLSAPVARVLADSIYWQALGNTVGISLLATLIATVLGTALGWLFGRTDLPRASLFEQLATLPIFIPPFVGAVAWTLLSAPRIGAFNVALRNLGLPEILDIYTRTAWPG